MLTPTQMPESSSEGDWGSAGVRLGALRGTSLGSGRRRGAMATRRCSSEGWYCTSAAMLSLDPLSRHASSGSLPELFFVLSFGEGEGKECYN